MEPLLMIRKEDLKNLANEVYRLIKNDSDLNNDHDNIINVKEAAKLLNLSPATIYGKTHRNEIPYFKRGKKLLFSKTDLIKWVKSGESPKSVLNKTDASSIAHEYLYKNQRY